MQEPNILEVAPIFPGTCMFCGSNNGPVVDLMQELPPYGRMYLCAHTCVPLIAEKLGYLDPESAKAMKEHAESLMIRIAEAETQKALAIEAMQGAIDDAREEARQETRKTAPAAATGKRA